MADPKSDSSLKLKNENDNCFSQVLSAHD